MRKQVFLLGEVDRTRKCLTRSPSSASFYFIGADDSFFLQQVNVGISKQAGRYAIPKSEKPVKQRLRHPEFDIRWVSNENAELAVYLAFRGRVDMWPDGGVEFVQLKSDGLELPAA